MQSLNNTDIDTILELSEKIEFNPLNKNEFILSNIHHQHYLKINLETYHLLSLIDGIKSLSQICEEYNAMYQKNITTSDIENLLYGKLSIYGILKGSEDNIKPYQKPSYLNLSFTIINQKLLSKIVTYFCFLFKLKTAIFTSVSSISLIIIFLLTNIDFYNAFSLQDSLIYFFLIKAISVTFHEIGHATSAYYFGAKTGGVGGGFYLFKPVYYTDVTDIWRLKKWQRIIVNLSGVYFEFIFCALLSLIAFFVNHHLLLMIAVFVSIHSLFNLIPLLRSDGYWILSDLINKPNLLKHGYIKIKEFLGLFIGKKLNWNAVDYLMFIYGSMSLTFMILFLYSVLIINPNSIIFFPINLIEFFNNIIYHQSEITLVKYGELIVPLIFYTLVFNLLKPWAIKILPYIQNVLKAKRSTNK